MRSCSVQCMSNSITDKPIVQVNTKAWRAALKRAGMEDFRWLTKRGESGWNAQRNATPVGSMYACSGGLMHPCEGGAS